MCHYLPERASFLETRQHVADDVLPCVFSGHHVALAGEFAGDVAHQLWFHHLFPSPSFVTDSRVTQASANRPNILVFYNE
jgi:hypothetical protein